MVKVFGRGTDGGESVRFNNLSSFGFLFTNTLKSKVAQTLLNRMRARMNDTGCVIFLLSTVNISSGASFTVFARLSCQSAE